MEVTVKTEVAVDCAIFGNDQQPFVIGPSDTSDNAPFPVDIADEFASTRVDIDSLFQRCS